MTATPPPCYGCDPEQQAHNPGCPQHALPAPPTPLPSAGSTAASPEAKRRLYVKRDAAALNPHILVNAEGKAARNASGTLTGHKIMSLEEQKTLASRISQKFGRMVLSGKDDETGAKLNASALKNLTAAYGIGSDKLTILSSRPNTPPMADHEVETHRDAILELARKLSQEPA